MTNLTISQLAQMTKAAGDPLRLSVLRLLGDGAFGVLELCRIFDIKQSSMSHHLKVLAQAGLVNSQREGNSIFYRRPLLTKNNAHQEWLRALFSSVDTAGTELDINHARDQVLAERGDTCAEFFTRHASDFEQQQDLIAAFDQYGATLQEIVQSLNWSDKATALEIGPGAGEFLPILAKQFSTVTALDISPDLLDRSRQTVATSGDTNIRFELGDSHWLVQQQRPRFDFVTANMVLHHVPAPKSIFADAAELLASKGTLLVCDLCHHQQDWAKQSCGDLWLGFEPEDLTAWALEAGLTEGPSQFLGLRNGFHIQFRLFHRH